MNVIGDKFDFFRLLETESWLLQAENEIDDDWSVARRCAWFVRNPIPGYRIRRGKGSNGERDVQ